jgi:hypothetical protein
MGVPQAGESLGPRLLYDEILNADHCIPPSRRSRIIYSREQLLSLASSPLSKTPPHIPAQISRSPDKTSHHYNTVTLGALSVGSNGASVGGGNGEGGGGGGGPGRASNGIQGAGSAVLGSSAQSAQSHSNGINGSGRTAVLASLSRSPPAASRNPGSAFDFSNGPISPTKVNNRSSPVKARQEQQHHHQSSDKEGKVMNGNGTHGEEQFSMEM